MYYSNILSICSNLIIFICRFSLINLTAGIYWALGNEPRRVFDSKAIAIHLDFLSSKVIIDSFNSSNLDNIIIVALLELDF